PVQSDTEQVIRKGGKGDMALPVINYPVVDLVGKEDQPVFSGEIHDPFKDFPGIEGARRVVGVDDNYSLGAAGDLLFHIIKVREPTGAFITKIMDGGSTGKGDRSGP